MIDISKFDGIKKNSAKSFNEQKALIKKVMAGRIIKCETCSQSIKLVLPEQSSSKKVPGLYCDKGCTDIALDFEC